MKNFISNGDSLTLTAPSGGVESGKPVVIGTLLVIPKVTVAEGQPFSALHKGVFKLAKTAANTPGELTKAYWNDTAKEFTTAASGNKLAGVFAAAGIADQTEIEVLLTGEL